VKRTRITSLAIVTAVALTAIVGVASASASASRFEAWNQVTSYNEYPAFIKGKSIGNPPLWTLGDVGVYSSCESIPFTGIISGAASNLTVIPSNCKGVEFNGCELTFHTGPETSKNTYEGTFDIGGAKCAGISMGPSSANCRATIPPQTGIKVTYGNQPTSPETAKITVSITGVKYIGVSGAGCPVGSHENGTWSSIWEVKAFKSNGGVEGPQIGLHLSPFPFGIYLEGGNFKSESYPASIVGNQVKALSFVGSSGMASVVCSSAHLSAALTASSSGLNPVSAEYGGCLSTETFKTTVNMNSCHYAIYSEGTLSIECSKGGDAIEIKSFKVGGEEVKCSTSIGPQSHKGLTFTNVTKGSTKSIEASFAIEGIEDTTAGGLSNCGTSNGSHTNGTYKGSVMLSQVE
jgi:hypothetical protein